MDLITQIGSVAALLTPVIVSALLMWFDKKNSVRSKARDTFNLLVFEGLEMVGVISVMTARRVNNTEGSDKALEDAIKKYEEHRIKVDAFRNAVVQSVIGV